ncbi:MAG: hypothetical protein U0133_14130 [Gemmatimonadales bacterium]
MRRLGRLVIGVLATGILGSVPAAGQAIAGGELPPAGYGSLKQDNINLRISGTEIEVRFLPLDERLTRLLAPDAYTSLHGLVESKRAAIEAAARQSGLTNPGLVLVSFFALRPAAQFDPDLVNISYRGQFERPAAIVPYTSNFSGRQLDVRQQASAIYLFDEPLPVFEPFEVVYGGGKAAWNDEVLRRIGVERVRVQSRAAADQKPDSAKGKP